MKGARMHGGTLKYHLTDNGQLFATALSVPCIALEQKVVQLSSDVSVINFNCHVIKCQVISVNNHQIASRLNYI